jgi:hypothetical protein
MMNVFHYEGERPKVGNETQKVGEKRNALIRYMRANIARNLPQLSSAYPGERLTRWSADYHVDLDRVSAEQGERLGYLVRFDVLNKTGGVRPYLVRKVLGVSTLSLRVTLDSARNVEPCSREPTTTREQVNYGESARNGFSRHATDCPPTRTPKTN